MEWIIGIVVVLFIIGLVSRASNKNGTSRNPKDGKIYQMASLKHIEGILKSRGLYKGTIEYAEEGEKLINNLIEKNYASDSFEAKQNRKATYLNIILQD